MSEAGDDRRAEKRTPGNEFYSVELSLPGLTYLYQFSLWDLSTRGLCILVRSDSPVLEFLHVGMVLEMKFYGPLSTESPRILNTEIKHISPDSDGRFRGHVLVGLSIPEQDSLPPASSV